MSTYRGEKLGYSGENPDNNGFTAFQSNTVSGFPPQAHQLAYPGYPAGVNPGIDPRTVRFNSAPTAPQIPGQPGVPGESVSYGHNKDPQNKKRGRWIVAGIAAVVAAGIAGGVVKVATEPSDKSTESPSADSGSSTSEVLYNESCYEAHVRNGEEILGTNALILVGSYQDIHNYSMPDILRLNLQSPRLKDDDGYTPVNVSPDEINSLTTSINDVIAGMDAKPGTIDKYGSQQGVGGIKIAKVGEKDGESSDGKLGPDQHLCAYEVNRVTQTN